jgi:uncharacterized membrane protein YeaQ/YmgE (transglycosylase-associated protein family)
VLELIGWDVGMSLLAAMLLVVGALIIGVIPQFIGDVTVGWEWAATAVAALVGGWLGSEALGTLSTWGPVYEGLYILPAIIGALIFGVAMDAVLRYVTRGSYVHSARPI